MLVFPPPSFMFRGQLDQAFVLGLFSILDSVFKGSLSPVRANLSECGTSTILHVVRTTAEIAQQQSRAHKHTQRKIDKASISHKRRPDQVNPKSE